MKAQGPGPKNIITEASEQCSSEQITLGPGEIWNHSSGRLMAQHCRRRPGNKEWVYWWRTVLSGATFYLVHIFLHSTSRQSPRQKLRAILKQFNGRKFSQEREPAKDSGTLTSSNCRKTLPPLNLKEQGQKKNVFISYGCYNELPQTWCLKTTDLGLPWWRSGWESACQCRGQGTQVRALVWEDPTCRGATRPVSHNYWACASGACAAIMRGPRTTMKSGPHLPQLEKALAQKRRPNTTINK